MQEFLLPKIAAVLFKGSAPFVSRATWGDALAFTASTETREKKLQKYSLTLGGGEWGDAGLVSSLPQLASMAALGKRWEFSGAGPSPFWPTPNEVAAPEVEVAGEVAPEGGVAVAREVASVYME